MIMTILRVYSLLLTIMYVCISVVHAQVDVRLSGGVTPFEGRVEIKRDNSEWRLVCAQSVQNWDLMEARIVCKQLGFVDVMWKWSNSEYGVSNLPVNVCDISCDVSATSLNDCTISSTESCNNCQDNQAGVTCYFPGFLGRYKEGIDPNRIFPSSSNIYTHENSNTTIQGCIQTCRDNSKPIAVLHSADECYCGDDDTDYQQYGEAVPGEMINQYVSYGTQQCSGDTGTEPYIQGCGGDYQLDVYDTTIGTCRRQFTGNTGYIYSPNFPGNYPRDQNCIWTITVEDNHIIQISMLMDKISTGDYLDIRDGDDVTAPQITWTSMKVYSTGNILRLQFHSNSDMNTDLGFVLTYQVIASLSTPSSSTVQKLTYSTHQNKLSVESTGTDDTSKYSSTPSGDNTFVHETTIKSSVPSSESKKEMCGKQFNQTETSLGVCVGVSVAVILIVVIPIIVLMYIFLCSRVRFKSVEEKEMTNLEETSNRTYQDLITNVHANDQDKAGKNEYQSLNFHGEQNKTEMDYVNTPKSGAYEELAIRSEVMEQKKDVRQRAVGHYVNTSINTKQGEKGRVADVQKAVTTLRQWLDVYDVTNPTSADDKTTWDMSEIQQAIQTLAHHVNTSNKIDIKRLK